MTELKRIVVDDYELSIETTEHTCFVWLKIDGAATTGVLLATKRTELEALVAARVALFKLYKACLEPPRSQPKPVEDAKV